MDDTAELDVWHAHLPCPFSAAQQDELADLLRRILDRQRPGAPPAFAGALEAHGTTTPAIKCTVDAVVDALLGQSTVDGEETRAWIAEVCRRGGLVTQHGPSPRIDWLLLRVRAASMLSIGAEHRYMADQAAYHYGKQLQLLEQIVTEQKQQQQQQQQ
ncbi:hypothetical protein SYNPS1DRAFT_30425 [Syncephalis pseudoplumigaleata]|nr:hypothetical protein SYNPS1DRAFT_30425 [Syncephalis pseudoplumigaleata]|eukprot:RKP23816.1 hypothetical protein SYNPS1DRAFT_30425 [Syncephalis pseudoplumigaleata]